MYRNSFNSDCQPVDNRRELGSIHLVIEQKSTNVQAILGKNYPRYQKSRDYQRDDSPIIEHNISAR